MSYHALHVNSVVNFTRIASAGRLLGHELAYLQRTYLLWYEPLSPLLAATRAKLWPYWHAKCIIPWRWRQVRRAPADGFGLPRGNVVMRCGLGTACRGAWPRGATRRTVTTPHQHIPPQLPASNKGRPGFPHQARPSLLRCGTKIRSATWDAAGGRNSRASPVR